MIHFYTDTILIFQLKKGNAAIKVKEIAHKH